MTPRTRIFIFKEHEICRRPTDQREVIVRIECGLKSQARNASSRAQRAQKSVVSVCDIMKDQGKAFQAIVSYMHYRAHPRHYRSEYVRGYLHRQAMCTAFQASRCDYSP